MLANHQNYQQTKMERFPLINIFGFRCILIYWISHCGAVCISLKTTNIDQTPTTYSRREKLYRVSPSNSKRKERNARQNLFIQSRCITVKRLTIYEIRRRFIAFGNLQLNLYYTANTAPYIQYIRMGESFRCLCCVMYFHRIILVVYGGAQNVLDAVEVKSRKFIHQIYDY